MRFVFFLIIFHFCAVHGFSQEICDNGIDDDLDGLIDLNDLSECLCSNDIIPNSDFEEYTLCPTLYSQIDRCTGWLSTNGLGSSDYNNQCGYSSFAPQIQDPSPYASGNGCVSFWDLYTNHYGYPIKEYAGVCLNDTFHAGNTYTIFFDIYTAQTNVSIFGLQCNSNDLNFTLFGTGNCANQPIFPPGYDCPTDLSSNWVKLDSVLVNYSASTWQNLSWTFTPSIDVTAISFGPGCALPTNNNCPVGPTSRYANYFYVDNLNVANPIISVDVVESGVFCNNSLTLTGQITGTLNTPTYQWYFNGVAIIGANALTYNVPFELDNIGDYQLRVVDGDNCLISSAFVIDSLLPAITVQVDPVSCNGGSDGSLLLGSNNAISPVNYYLDGNILSTTDVDSLFPGNYSVVMVDSNGCSDTQNIDVFEPTPVLLMPVDTVFCLETGDYTLNALASGGSPPYSYLWNNQIGTETHSISVSQDLNVSVQAVDSKNCLSSVESILITHIPDVDFMADDTVGCVGFSPIFTLSINGTSDLSSVSSVAWDFGDSNINTVDNPVEAMYNYVGEYDVSTHVYFNNGCSKLVNRDGYIFVKGPPTAAFIPNPQVVSVLNPNLELINTSQLSDSFSWSFDGLVFSEIEHTNYNLLDTDTGMHTICLVAFGCYVDTVCVNIFYKDELFLYVPTAFTPNSDGINDVFQVKKSGLPLTYFSLQIYDRWGGKVKTFSDINDFWDGGNLNAPYPIGMYLWQLEAQAKEKPLIVKNGVLFLTR